LETRHLRNFLKIAELGSISRAAGALGVSQPSLSQQILRLEDEVGAKLFERTARGVRITSAGEILVRNGREALKFLEAAPEEIRRAAAEDRNRVALGMPFSISRLLAVTLTENVLEHHPSVHLRIHEGFSGSILAMLREEKLHLGLLYDVEPLDGLRVTRLAREDLYLIGPPGRFSGPDGTVSAGLHELTGLPLIVPGPAHGLRQALEREARRLELRLKIASEIDTLEHIVGLVADGRGYSILPLAAAAGDLRAGRISATRLDADFRRTLCLAGSVEHPPTEATRIVEAMVGQQIRHLIQSGAWLATPETASSAAT
jgi:LysR family nitrogen assimilation transcriptional regulator